MMPASATAPVRRPILRRVAPVVLGVVLVVAGVLAIAPVLVPKEAVRNRIAELIEQWLGRPATFSGDPAIALYPRPTVTIQNVVIGDDSGGVPLLTVERVVGTVALLPLFLGRVEFSAFSLMHPVVNLRVDSEGRSNWVVRDGAIGARLAEAQEAYGSGDAAPDVTLGRFLIENGTVTYQQADGPLSEITDVALDISWPSTAGGMTASGNLNWRNEPVAIFGYLARPLELFGGRASPARFAVDAAPAALTFEGSVSRHDLDFALSGTTSLTTGSLRRLLSWAGANIPEEGSRPGPAAIVGDASWTWPFLAFSNGTMSLDGNSAAGSFSVDFSGNRPFIRGTMAANTLDLTPYAVSLRTGVEDDGTWIGAPIDLPALTVIDTDLRLSAEEVRMGTARMTGVAASATVTGGRLLLSLEEANFYGGRLRATVSGLVAPESLTLHATASVSGMAALPALQKVAGVTVLAGTVDGIIDAGGTGTTWSSLLADVTGSMTATISAGALRSIDLPGAAGTPNPTVATLGLGTGATEFTRFEGSFHFADGFVVTDRFDAHGPGYELSFTGRASLLRPTIDGRGSIAFTGAEPTLLPFILAGTWVAPELTDPPPAIPNAGAELATTPSGVP